MHTWHSIPRVWEDQAGKKRGKEGITRKGSEHVFAILSLFPLSLPLPLSPFVYLLIEIMAAFGLSIGGTNAAVGVLRVSPHLRKGERITERTLFSSSLFFFDTARGHSDKTCHYNFPLAFSRKERERERGGEREEERKKGETWEEIKRHSFPSLCFPTVPLGRPRGHCSQRRR
jgi:hypothetical protein